MTERGTPTHFGTDPAWLAAVREWAASEPNVEKVWVFGSRATGVRREKEGAKAEPDLDVAYVLSSTPDESALGQAVCLNAGWQSRLQAQIAVKLDLQYADEDDSVVMPAVRDHGVLIYDRNGS